MLIIWKSYSSIHLSSSLTSCSLFKSLFISEASNKIAAAAADQITVASRFGLVIASTNKNERIETRHHKTASLYQITPEPILAISPCKEMLIIGGWKTGI